MVANNYRRNDIDHLARVATMRHSLAELAEQRVREAESKVREIEAEEARIVSQIQQTQTDAAHRGTLDALKKQRKALTQALENAKAKLVEMNAAWIETRREQKVIERVQARRLQEWQREDELRQKLKSSEPNTLKPAL